MTRLVCEIMVTASAVRYALRTYEGRPVAGPLRTMREAEQYAISAGTTIEAWTTLPFADSWVRP